MKDVSNIGSTQAVQNPQDAIDSAQGKYADNTASLSEQQRFAPLQMPAAPDPQPYTLTGGGKGTR